MSAQLLNPPRVLLMRRPCEPKEFCQDCLIWGRETVLNPLGDCPVCDAETLDRDDTHDVYVRQIAAGVK